MATCSIPGAKFFGCSVVDFNASAGWGAQSSEVTINLVADCAEDFDTPTVGEAATFKIGEFSFTGMVQSWNSRGGSDGFFYLVKLISPHPILDNTQIILDNYQGCVPFYNILNVYGYLESLGSSCSHQIIGKTVFGAPSGGFGASSKTARGIPWYLVKNAIQSLAGGIGLGDICYSKGLRFKGRNYILDLSDIPLSNNNYRITGPVISLTDLINQVCEDAGCDYYIHMFDSGGIGSTSIIKVVTIARKDGYTLGQIRRFVEDDQSKVISKAVGQELRSEVNSVLLVGAKVKQYYQCIDPDGMTPFWGWDAEGNLLEAVQEAQRDGDGNVIFDVNNKPIPKVNGWKVKLDFRTINLTLNEVIPQDFGWIGENQLRAAAADFESFRKDIQDTRAEKDGDDSNKDNVLYKYFTDTLGFKIIEVRDHLNVFRPVQPIVSIDPNDPTGAPGTPQMRDGKALHHWLASYASQVYGKQFLAYFTLNTAPEGGVLCRSVDSDTNQVIYSDDISTDGGWASELLYMNADGKIVAKDADKILDLPNPSIQTDRFKDESGKVQPMIQFNAGNKDINIQDLSNDDFIAKDNKVWIKASVDEKWVNGTPINPDGGVKFKQDGDGNEIVDPSPVENPTVDTIRSALVTLSNGVVDQEGTENSLPAFRPVLKFTPTGPLELHPILRNAQNMLDGQQLRIQARGDAYMLSPHGMGIPVKSNTICYGPWQAAGADPGSTQVEIDDGLAPWEYGGLDYMELAGQAKIDIAYTDQQTADRGEVTVPGIPTLSLAENIDGGGGIGDRNVGRASISIPFPPPASTFHFSFYYWNSKLNGGAVISNISVSAGQGGVTTTYTVNSFTPVFGRFSKGNADRLKRIGFNRQKGERDLRARVALRNLISASERRTNLANAASEAAAMKGRGDVGPESAAITFAGKLVGHSSSSHQRHVVMAPKLTTMRFYAESEFQKTSVNTMDGFFRPVQSTLSNDGDLPRVNENDNPCDVGSQTTGPPPPVWNHEDSKATGSTIADSLNISARYLNFLVNADEADYKNVTENPINWIAEAQDPAGKKGRARDSTKGHDIEGVARGVAGEEWTDNEIAEPQEGAPGRLLMVSGGLDDGTTIHDYNDDYRFMALRGPLMVHGWGYDINGKPIPNKEGDEPGFFADTYAGLTNEFADDWLENANTWPVAPVDLRFDRLRGVWTVPSAFRLYQIAVTGSGGFSSNSTDTCEVIKYKQDLLNDDGSPISIPEIQVENWTNTHIASGTKALAYYDTAECKYWIIPPPSGASGTLKIGTTGCSDEDPCLDTRTCIPCTDTTGCLIFSGGLAGSWRNDIGGDLVVTGPTIRASGSEGLQAPHHFDSLVVGSGMSLLVENCSGIIAASGACTNGITTGIPFVQDVCCSGSTFITIKRELTFSKGCLTSVTESGSCPDC